MSTWQEKQAARHLEIVVEWVREKCLNGMEYQTMGPRLYNAFCDDSKMYPKPSLRQFYRSLDQIHTRRRVSLGTQFVGVALKRDYPAIQPGNDEVEVEA